MSLLTQTILPKDKPQIITTRLIAAPRELVWKALTTPEHLQHFWGPDGFTNTYMKYDLREGGEALYTMHGPDGTDYVNRMRFSEVIANTRIVAETDAGKDGPDQYRFRYEIALVDEGGKTRVTISLLIADLATRDEMAKFAAVGGRQNLDRLAVYVAPMAAEKNLFVIERSFAVSQARLFKACTNVEELTQWFAPPGMKVIKASQDFRVGGVYHYGSASPQGQEMWGKATYKEITPNSRLVYLQSFSDKDGGITAHPMAPTWPQEMVTVFEFIPEGEKQTRLKISWIYAGVDDTEASTFHAAHAGMTGGWTSSLDALQNYLSKN